MSTRLYAVSPTAIVPYLESQILAQYPLAVISEEAGPKIDWQKVKFGQMQSRKSYYYPLKTYQAFKEVDPLSGLLGVMSKAQPEDFFLVQILLAKPGRWQKQKFLKAIQQRTFAFYPPFQVFNVEELATLWHLPNFAWLGTRS